MTQLILSIFAVLLIGGLAALLATIWWQYEDTRYKLEEADLLTEAERILMEERSHE